MMTIRHLRLLLLIVGVLVVGIQLELFQTSELSTRKNHHITSNQDPTYPKSSFVTSPFSRFSAVIDDPSSVVTKESWKEWESKFLVNNTILFEQLQKSSIYGTIDTDDDDDECDKDYLRDYVQVTEPATANSILSDNCNWPERIQHLEYPWNRSQLSLPSSSCPFVHFSPEQACKVLQERSQVILLFIGDSLIRQILVGLGTVLTGNVRNGGLQYIHPQPKDDYSQVWKRICSCENQYFCATLKQEEQERFTHVFGYNPETFRNQVDLCSNHKTIESSLPSYQILFEQQNNNPKISPMVRQLIASHPKHQFVIVTDASSLHLGLNIRKTRRFLQKLERLLLKHSFLIIPMTVHFVGANKPIEFQELQGRQPVEDYNQQLRKMAKNKQYKVLDTYTMTRGMPSHDGTHYPMASVALAQILLLYIRDYISLMRG